MPDLAYESIELNREHGPWQYPLSDRLQPYLDAVENGLAWNREASPWGPPVAPPTIMGNATLRFIDSIAPVPPGTLHAKVEMEISNALRRDRELIGYGEFLDKYEKRGRRWFRFSARWRDGSALLIGRATVTMAFPDASAGPEKTGALGEAKERGDEKPRQAKLKLGPRMLTQERLTAYSEDSANALRGQSIHTDPKVAKAKGYPATVAQGLMSADYVSELMTHQFERGWLLNGRLSLAFVRPVLCGDTLTACASPKEELDEGAFIRHVHDVWCENGDGDVVTVGTASGVVAAARPVSP